MRDQCECITKSFGNTWAPIAFTQYLIDTEEGKAAEKRVRVYCGVCKETRYYSIHRGVTRIGSVVLACEACRHYYQKFKRQPCILRCRDKDVGRCGAWYLTYHPCFYSLSILVIIFACSCGIFVLYFCTFVYIYFFAKLLNLEVLL